MSLPIDRILIVPRWAGTPTSDCYPWLIESLQGRYGRGLEVRALAMPEPSTPKTSTWPPVLLAEAGENKDLLRRTLVVGHSVGCQTVLRALAAMPDDLSVFGVLLIAAWFQVDRPWETILPWMVQDFDLNRARARTPWLDVLVSDNDPFTANFEQTAADFRDRANANVVIVPGAKHFNAVEEPRVLEALVERIEGKI
ncbi:MAG: alpha/beta hydrolase [Polyangiaceae bacterium]|nr:alpha/beta hydrolase [Polyangiaceae bacterium]